MKNKGIHAAFLTAIILLCLIPSLGMFLPRPESAGGNETLSAAPALRDQEGHLNTAWFSQMLDYIEDHYFLRQEMITAWSNLNASVFRTSISDDVILGRDDWLYFGDTLPDYTGTASMDAQEIYSAAHNLALVSEYCRKQNAQFLFTIAPNKNSLYPEHMPDLTVRGGTRNADALAAELERQNVPYLDLFECFRNQTETLYFSRDSHWDSKGAALAADALNQALGRESDYFLGPFTPVQNHLGDLYNMLYPTGKSLEIDQAYGGVMAFTYDTPIRSADDLTINTTSSRAQERSLLMFRDSFGKLLYPYLADSFGHARFSRSTAYRLDWIEQCQADCVVVELVERNLRYLLQNVPLMPAPLREEIPEELLLSDDVPLLKEPADNLPGFVLLTGQLPQSAETESPIYVPWANQIYEAFLLEGHRFALYVPEG